MSQSDDSLSYREAGVDVGQEDMAVDHLVRTLRATLSFNDRASPLNDFGAFAAVLDIGLEQHLAITTDGVGTKLLVAQMIGKYNTVGIDCVAMNVNDLLCVGAEPITLVDYIAVEAIDPHILDELAHGLREGAELAEISVCGGEVAQLREMIIGLQPGRGFDLVGTGIGLVRPDTLLLGDQVEPGDQILGILSNGIHSNGLTLARRALFDTGGYAPEDVVAPLDISLGAALLTPTSIYVRPVKALFASNVNIHGAVHITGGGWLNLKRVQQAVGFRIDCLPARNPIFQTIQEAAHIADAEMFEVFNMGIGFCLILSAGDVDQADHIIRESGWEPLLLGEIVSDHTEVEICPEGLVSDGARFMER